eukprot:scaffold2088_cov23-Cyclotella_meneghiniana.AAC.1
MTLDPAGPGDCLNEVYIATDETVKDGEVIYLQNQSELSPSRCCPIIVCGTGHAPCKMTKILWKLGKSTGGVKVENPPSLSQAD